MKGRLTEQVQRVPTFGRDGREGQHGGRERGRRQRAQHRPRRQSHLLLVLEAARVHVCATLLVVVVVVGEALASAQVLRERIRAFTKV